ncbi:MAG: LicD family protein [Chlamydiales bacterium]
MDKFGAWIFYVGLPVTQVYHLLCGSIFFNAADDDAQGIDKIANYVLAPTHYLFCGSRVKNEVGLDLSPRFSYDEHFLVKTATSFVALPLSAGAGALLKAAAYLMPETRKNHHKILDRVKLIAVDAKSDYYRSLGMKINDYSRASFANTPTIVRGPIDHDKMKKEQAALKEIVTLLHAHKIPFWVDCGTLLGTYRHGGVIPWDWDLDIAILAPDFDNVKSVLSGLDPEKCVVQDWSGRERPKSYLKVYVKGTPTLIDIYHFDIDPKKKVLRSIFSNEGSPFLPESMKIRERRYCVETPFDLVFPLKRAFFEGIEVPVPGKMKEYLQLRYGEDLRPAKVYNPDTGNYENDLSHPYWKIPHAH